MSARAATIGEVMVRERAVSGRTLEVQTLAGQTLPEGVRAFVDHLGALLSPATSP